MTTLFGIFLHTNNVSDEWKEESLKALLRLCSESSITYVMDFQSVGFKIYFKDKHYESILLDKKFLQIFGTEVGIYPLTSNLVIQNASPFPRSDLPKDVEMALKNRFGPILFSQQLALDKFPAIASGNWGIVVAIPEVEELDIFNEKLLSVVSDNSNSCIPVPEISFLCSVCHKMGHSRQKCKNTTASPSTNQENFRTPIFPENCPSTSKLLSPVETFARKIGEEVVHKSGFVEGDKLHKTEDNNPQGTIPKCFEDIKSAIKRESNANNEDKKEYFQKRPSLEINIKKEMSDDSCSLDLSTKASSTTHDDDVVILEDSIFMQEMRKAGLASSSQAMKVPPVPSSSTTDAVSPTASSDSEHEKLEKVIPVAKDGVSSRLGRILETSTKKGPLNTQQLQAFFTHVKKKSNPAKIASNYTKDVEGLKSQLKTILFLYYNTPESGTKKDKEFIKWLRELLRRFDQPPVSRRRIRNEQPTETFSRFRVEERASNA